MRITMISLLLLFAALTVHADSVFTGEITLTGPSITQTIDVSFDFTWGYLTPLDTWSPSSLSNLSIVNSGPLVFSGNGGAHFGGYEYCGLSDGLRDEIDIINTEVFNAPGGIPSQAELSEPPVLTVAVYECNSIPCQTDFGGTGQAYGPDPYLTYILSDPTGTPEPSTLALLLFGIVVILWKMQ
jgi:hypothetical protein